MQHLKCAAFELPFRAGDAFGSLGADETADALGFLEKHAVLHEARGTFHWAADAYPANNVSLRSVGWDNVVIIDVEHDATPRRDRLAGAHTMVHEQAIYQHDGECWQVERFDYENHKAFVRKVAPDYYTDAMTHVQVALLEETARALGDRATARGSWKSGWGEVSVVEKVVGYKKIKFHTHENAGYGDVRLPEMQMHTTAYWLRSPRSASSRARAGERRRSTRCAGSAGRSRRSPRSRSCATGATSAWRWATRAEMRPEVRGRRGRRDAGRRRRAAEGCSAATTRRSSSTSTSPGDRAVRARLRAAGVPPGERPRPHRAVPVRRRLPACVGPSDATVTPTGELLTRKALARDLLKNAVPARTRASLAWRDAGIVATVRDSRAVRGGVMFVARVGLAALVGASCADTSASGPAPGTAPPNDDPNLPGRARSAGDRGSQGCRRSGRPVRRRSARLCVCSRPRAKPATSPARRSSRSASA